MSGVWRIGKVFRFEAARETGGSLDGHSFTAEAVLSASRLDEVGFVVDFGRLASLKKYIDAVLDHQVLNGQVPDVTDTGIAAHLTAWAREHLPPDVAPVLEGVRVRPGRARPGPGAATVEFGAAHRLRGLPAGHPCGRFHGHSYLITVPRTPGDQESPAPIPQRLRRYVAGVLDGSVLNDVVAFNPTSELLAEHFAAQLGPAPKVGPVAVRVSETETSWAEYTRSPR
ncbi:6-pyruvoyl trahydropterin synthase family protein [Streptomyces qinzhouensis]|uniref:6-carboxy-5,6,7,8-tetrahydropterin synthase n=1 Tax=Streptomyces qinzhouensis TaxID=2599401 RepID=A0A5B8J294_9ACTN|nr:6-carboxytetrahydropterin synthase [Streptomyces qinzhouensis]QDY75347.1 6-pyruvoyl tetrahydropterin synthase [Streptomyces qinzhouensis]